MQKIHDKKMYWVSIFKIIYLPGKEFNIIFSPGITYVFLPKFIYMKLFVAGLPYDLDDAELEEIFEKFGTITSARVAIDRETGKSKGFGFVEMQNDSEAKEAIENLKDISLGKKPLIVTQAEERSSPKPPNRGGGYRR